MTQHTECWGEEQRRDLPTSRTRTATESASRHVIYSETYEQLRSFPTTALTSLTCSLGVLLKIVPYYIRRGKRTRNRFCRPEVEVWMWKVACTVCPDWVETLELHEVKPWSVSCCPLAVKASGTTAWSPVPWF